MTLPLDITQVDNAVVVRGQYHVLAHDLGQGRNTWSIEFAPPGVNPFALIAMGAVTAGVAAGNARNGWGNTSASTLQSANNISNAYQNEASKRFAAPSSSRSAQLSTVGWTSTDIAIGYAIGETLLAPSPVRIRISHIGL